MGEASGFSAYIGAYHEIYSSKSQCELLELAEVKRYLEVFSGNEQFRNNVLSCSISLERSAEIAGVTIDVSSLLPAFHPAHRKELASLNPSRWPLAVKWKDYVEQLLHLRSEMLNHGDTHGLSKKYDAWRLRQIRRVGCDVGLSAQGIVHPPIAFELSSGCSVGCWFCGISADKFKGHFALDEAGTRAWHDILDASHAVLGDGMKSGFLYWATDPLDNPDYLGFLDAYYERCGIYPQTTTSIPLRNVALTRGVLERAARGQGTPNRFSILNSKILSKVHAEFSALELLRVELVLQNFENITNAKTNAGRTFDSTKAGGTPNTEKSHINEGTIACVSGFLVNIVEKTVRLVSPCMPSERNRDGFIVYHQRTYADAKELGKIMQSMIDRFMPLEIESTKPLVLSENFQYHFDGKAFVLETPTTKITSSALDSFAPFLDVEGTSALNLVKQAVRNGENMFAVVDAIERSRNAGLIDMLPEKMDRLSIDSLPPLARRSVLSESPS